MNYLYIFELLIIAALGGLFGTYLMDKISILLNKKNITSGGSTEWLGRWFLHIFKGKFIHQNIAESPKLENEYKAGIFFHYIMAGAGIALLYVPLLLLTHPETFFEHLLLAISFGISTSIFPWFWMMPSLGWGFFGLKRVPQKNTILAPIITHIVYGIGLGLVMYIATLLIT